jgi:lysozyme family protein
MVRMGSEMTFDIAFDRLIGHEGGYVNNPSDPGGETNW